MECAVIAAKDERELVEEGGGGGAGGEREIRDTEGMDAMRGIEEDCIDRRGA